MRHTFVCAAAIALAASAPALGQTSEGSGAGSGSDEGSKPAPSTKPLTVTGKQPDYRRDADKRSYSIAGDLQAANGSIADALRNIPSVDVDLQGNVSLRGDSNVTILVDGQPSALFKGPNKGDLLQQLPADQYERVEVMTNPSAAYSPEGTGGIINLVSKKAHAAQTTVKISGGASTLGQDRASLTGSGGVGRLSLSGSLSGIRYANSSDDVAMERIEDPASGETADVLSQGQDQATQWSMAATGQAAYAFDPATQLSEGLEVFQGANRSAFGATYRSSALTGVLAQDYDDTGAGRASFISLGSNTSFRRDLGGDSHYAIATLNLTRLAYSFDSTQSFDYSLPVQPDLFQDIGLHASTDIVDLKAEYHGPLGGGAKLVAGYDFNVERQAQGQAVLIGTTALNAAPNPALGNEFAADQTVHSLYATYDRPFGNLDVQPGLRLEDVVITTHNLALAVRGGQSYFEAYPTLDLAYQLGDGARITASYSRRIDRSNPSQLDPARVYSNPLGFSQGNPDLKPSITDAYEAAYEYTGKSIHYLATLFYKDKGELVTSEIENLGGGVLLSTYANVGHDRNLGLELTSDGAVSKTLSYRATLDTDWDDLQDPGVVVGGARSGLSVFGNARLSWTPTRQDFVQLDVHASGRKVSAQGFVGSWANANIGYRRLLTDRISAEVRVIDVFASDRFVDVVETPTLTERTTNRPHDRSAFFTLSYTFGRVAKSAPKDIDFDSGAGSAADGPS